MSNSGGGDENPWWKVVVVVVLVLVAVALYRYATQGGGLTQKQNDAAIKKADETEGHRP